MATDQSYVREIKSYGWEDLNELWELIISGKTGSHGWGEGRAFEYFIIRAFELSGAEVVYPFETKYHDIVLEQSNGIIYAQNQVYLVECKDQSKNINFDAIAKLKVRLQRRPQVMLGSIFSTKGFTEPAIMLANVAFPSNIILWKLDDITYALKGRNFTDGMYQKFKELVKHGIGDYDINVGTI